MAIHSLIRLDIDMHSLDIISLSKFSLTKLILSLSSDRDCGFNFLTDLFMIAQKFSIGLRSGYLTGQSNRLGIESKTLLGALLE